MTNVICSGKAYTDEEFENDQHETDRETIIAAIIPHHRLAADPDLHVVLHLELESFELDTLRAIASALKA